MVEDSLSKWRAAPAARGLLWANEVDGSLDVRRFLPSEDLAPFIHHFGSAHWDLRSPLAVDTLPHPAGRIELDVTRGVCRAEVVGLRTGRFGNCRTGRGQFFVAQFRAATLQPLLGAAMSSLTDRAVPVASVLGPRADAWVSALCRARSPEAELELTEAFLREVIPVLPPPVAAMRDLVERIGADSTVCRVQRVAELASLDMRTLQRRFRKYVGAHPKWVIQRYRLQEAAQQLRAATPVALSRLAADLGYADQAHFARDFRRVMGHPPGHFTRTAGPYDLGAMKSPARSRA
ncbi:MAG TPA: helix-turn-helix domain-containing protein [Polyangiales bacterium]|nr:helix-turn-helix domain-containing protein [Polyangiales bacterium]